MAKFFASLKGTSESGTKKPSAKPGTIGRWPEAISNGPLGNLGNSKTQLFGAYRVLEYLLGQVSQNRVEDMKQEVKDLFDKMPDDIVKQIILQNSGFQLSVL